MTKYEKLYLISPSLFVTELDKELSEIRTRQAELEEAIADFKNLTNQLLVQALSHPRFYISKWHYDVRFPAFTLDNVYGLERVGRIVKRWVGPEPFIELPLFLDRSVQYEFDVRLADFANDEVKEGFALLVNGEDLPWISTDKMLYKAVIPQDRRVNASDITRIVLGCRDGTRTATPATGDPRTLWFSISSIDVQVSERVT